MKNRLFGFRSVFSSSGFDFCYSFGFCVFLGFLLAWWFLVEELRVFRGFRDFPFACFLLSFFSFPFGLFMSCDVKIAIGEKGEGFRIRVMSGTRHSVEEFGLGFMGFLIVGV